MPDPKKFKLIQGGGEAKGLFNIKPEAYELWTGRTPAKPLTMKSLLGALEFLACDICLQNMEESQTWILESAYYRAIGSPGPEKPKPRHCNRHDKLKVIKGEG